MSAAAEPVSAAAASKPERQLSGWEHMRPLLPYLWRYKGMMAVGLLALAMTGIIGAIPQLAQGIIADSLTGLAQPLTTLTGTARHFLGPLLSHYAPLSTRALGFYCIVIVVAMAVKGFFTFWSRWILIGISREIEYDLRNDLLGNLVCQDPEFYVRNRTGDLMSRATNDLNNVRMVLGPGIMYSASTIATSVISLYFMIKLSGSLTIWTLIPVPIVVLSVYYFGRIIHASSERIQAALGTLSTRAQENLTGVRVVRAYAQENQEIASFEDANREYVNRYVKLISAWSLFFPALMAMIGVSVVVLLGKGGASVMSGAISLGTLWSFYTFLSQLTFPIIALGWVTNIFQRGAASMGRLNFILHARPGIRDASAGAAVSAGNGQPHAEASAEIRGDIEFRHLTFSYPTAPDDPVLIDINLHVPAGSTLAIVGPTGCGKSTLAALVARLWEAPPGAVLIDGRPIRDYPLQQLRRVIGYVPQDTFLFSETLRENIAFGVQEATDSRVTDAAGVACIDTDIEGFPRRYETMVGERGITLSGGQKQRTSLARAIIRDPRILILDDSLSSVDTDTEERILRGLRGVMRERTTILVSHRISTVQAADQIILLHQGRIAERGTHESLLALGGDYAELYQRQLLEEELARE
ncbi:MAG TPA: ABC transporter ATP-binding protein [Candidatus Acidoferrales bacterium]|nr:ABC transporter ATP-binding protein [Candidatus Acidoferrales bacterium]